MVKKLVVLVLLLVFCSISAFAGDIWDTLVVWVREEVKRYQEVNGCSFSPDTIYYNGTRIDIGDFCDAHDRAYIRKENKEQADLVLGRDIYYALRAGGVPENIASRISTIYYAGVSTFGWWFY